MKIENASSTAANSGNQFTIAATGKAFRILSDGLYADKIKAIIRELSCNARDSHVASGSDQPWDMHLPTEKEPWFEVRDYGTGMSHDQIMDIYTRYFASTKTSSNDFVGQLGLGSKSPFSFTREFNVESRHGGKTLRYRMFFDDSDTPCVEQISEGMATDSGLSVRFPVPAGHDRWADKASQVLRWFDSKPRLTGGQCDTEEPEVRWRGDGWRIFKTDGRNDQAMAIMGGVCYPINGDSIPGISTKHRRLCGVAIAIDFEIGDLDVAASREGLSYDNRTCANIGSRFDDVISGIAALYQDSVGQQPTEWLARKAWKEWKNKNSYNLQLVLDGQVITWQGQVIDNATKSVDFATLYSQGDRGMRAWAYGHKGNSKPSSLVMRCDPDTAIIFDDVAKGSSSRAKAYHLSKGTKQATILFGPSSTHDWDAMRAVLGGPEVIMASSLPVPPRLPSAQGVRIDGYVMGNGYGKGAWNPIQPSQMPDTKATAYWVELNAWDPIDYNGRTMNGGTLRMLVAAAVDLGYITNLPIYGFRHRYAKQARKITGWYNIMDKLSGFAKTVSENQAILQEVSDSAAASTAIDTHYSSTHGIRNLLSGASDEWIDGIRSEDSVMRKLISAYRSQSTGSRKVRDSAMSLMSHFRIEPVLPAPTHGLNELLETAMSRYGMLVHASSRWNEAFAADALRYVNTVDMSYDWEILSRD